MSFPKIKRAEPINPHNPFEYEFSQRSILTERDSRAVWARALAKALRECNLTCLDELEDELLAEAEKDEGTK